MNKNLIIDIKDFNSSIDIESNILELPENDLIANKIEPPNMKDFSFQRTFKLPKVRILELEYKLKKK